MLYPFMPSTAERIWEQLHLEEDISRVEFDDAIKWGGMKPGTRIQQRPSPVPENRKKRTHNHRVVLDFPISARIILMNSFK